MPVYLDLSLVMISGSLPYPEIISSAVLSMMVLGISADWAELVAVCDEKPRTPWERRAFTEYEVLKLLISNRALVEIGETGEF